MGNSTRPKSLSPKRNVEPTLNKIRRRTVVLRNKIAMLKNAYKKLGVMINSGNFYESNLVNLHSIPVLMSEVVAEKKALDRMYTNLIHHQLGHGF